MELKLAYFLDDRYLNGEQSQFVDLVHQDLTDFYRQSSFGVVLLFPPVNNFLRLLIHKSVEDYPGLHSFSIGVEEGRQTVVCWRQNCLASDKNQFGSVESSGPWTMRGRGRARYRDGNSSSPGSAYDDRLNRGNNQQLQTRESPGDQRQWRNTTSRSHVDKPGHRSEERLEEGDRSPSTQSFTKSGSTSHVKKLDRSKNRRPDVQVYVPKARRQQRNQTDPVETVERSPVRSSHTSRRSDQKRAEIQYYVPRGRQQKDQEMVVDNSCTKKDFWDIALGGDENDYHVSETSHSRSDNAGTHHDRIYDENDYNVNVPDTRHGKSYMDGTQHDRTYDENEHVEIERKDSARSVHDSVVNIEKTYMEPDNDNWKIKENVEDTWNPEDVSEPIVDTDKHIKPDTNMPNNINYSDSSNIDAESSRENGTNSIVDTNDETERISEDLEKDNAMTDTLDNRINNCDKITVKCDNDNVEVNENIDDKNNTNDGDHNIDDGDGSLVDNTCRNDNLVKTNESNKLDSLLEQNQNQDINFLNTAKESLDSELIGDENLEISARTNDPNEKGLEGISSENDNLENVKHELSQRTDLSTSKTEECGNTVKIEQCQDYHCENYVNKFEQGDTEAHTSNEQHDDNYNKEVVDSCDNQNTNKTCEDLHGNNDSYFDNMDTCVSETTSEEDHEDQCVPESKLDVDNEVKSNIKESDSNVVDNVESVTEEIDEDSWDAMFNDDGDCLDPTAMEELTKTVGKVKIKKSKKINYLEYQPKDKTDFDYTNYNHIIEIYDFPAEFVTRDLIMAFQSFMSRGFDLKWVDDTHALGIFSSAIAAQDALSLVHPLLKVCPLSQASKQSKNKAKRCTEFLQPYKPRPETSAMAARRLVAGALGIATNVSREKREKERQQLKEAKAKRRKDRQNRDDIWEFGGKCAMDEES